MDKKEAITALQEFMKRQLSGHSWVSASLNAERLEGVVKFGISYSEQSGKVNEINRFDFDEFRATCDIIDEVFRISIEAGAPRWNILKCELSPDTRISIETSFNQQIDDEIRFYDAGGEVDEWQDIEDERDAFLATGGSEADWRLRIEQLIANREAAS